MERQRLRDPQPLEQRITRALSPDNDIASSAIAALYNEFETAIADAEANAEAAKTRALDPTIDDPAAARQQRDDCIFRLARLRAALPKLQQRYSEVRLAERRAQWRAAYAEVKANRDATASELKEAYALVDRLVVLLNKAKKVDEQVEAINRSAPNSEHDRLLTVECVARSLNAVPANVSLMTTLKLPVFDAPGQWLWPPPVPPIIPEMVVPAGMYSHPGANCHVELKERDARRQAEAKRLADYHRRREREREDMENARARAEQERRWQAAST